MSDFCTNCESSMLEEYFCKSRLICFIIIITAAAGIHYCHRSLSPSFDPLVMSHLVNLSFVFLLSTIIFPNKETAMLSGHHRLSSLGKIVRGGADVWQVWLISMPLLPKCPKCPNTPQCSSKCPKHHHTLPTIIHPHHQTHTYTSHISMPLLPKCPKCPNHNTTTPRVPLYSTLASVPSVRPQRTVSVAATKCHQPNSSRTPHHHHPHFMLLPRCPKCNNTTHINVLQRKCTAHGTSVIIIKQQPPKYHHTQPTFFSWSLAAF